MAGPSRSRHSNVPPRYHVDLRESANVDIEGIWLNIARSNPLNAERYVDRIYTALETLSLLPHARPEPPGLAGIGLRQLLIGSHRAIYSVNDAARIVTVARVLHTSASTESYETELRKSLDL